MGTITVKVIRDVNGNGSYDASLETGQAGIEIAVTDPSGNIARGTTNSSGEFVVDPAGSGLTGGVVRVQATIPGSLGFLQPARSGGPAPSLSPLTTMLDASNGDVTVVMGVTNPGSIG